MCSTSEFQKWPSSKMLSECVCPSMGEVWAPLAKQPLSAQTPKEYEKIRVKLVCFGGGERG